MSKVGQWVMEMQEDAASMTEQEFVKRHGQENSSIWQEVNGPDDSFWDLDEPCDKVWALAFTDEGKK